ncbi:MAG: 50S ribosomal protein L4 [Candidatus Bathyarchaeia archaeon]
MQVDVLDLEGKPIGKISLPEVFSSEVRADLIRRAVHAYQSHRLQPQGRDPMAGKRTSAQSYGVGHGLARLPRVKGERYTRAGQAAFAPSTVKGRATHPPRADKVLRLKVNKKERLKALRSAVAATASREFVTARGHLLDGDRSLPIVVSDEAEKISRTQEAKRLLESLGVWVDVERVLESVKVRPGKGKMRGRGRRHRVGPLLVIHQDQGLAQAARNLLGVSVVDVKSLNAEDLAPGTHPGRLTVWTESAVKALGERFKEG